MQVDDSEKRRILMAVMDLSVSIKIDSFFVMVDFIQNPGSAKKEGWILPDGKRDSEWHI